MKTTFKNLNNQENSDIVKKQADKVFDDAMKLLYDIRYIMATLGQISLTVESIMCNACDLNSGYNEEVLDNLLYKKISLIDTDSFHDKLNRDYTIDMVKFIEDIQQLLGEYQDTSLDEYYDLEDCGDS